MSTTMAPTPAREMKSGDFASNQDVRWCPGCGDYSILANAKKALASAGVEPDQIAWISGIGCSSRFPYYMSTYGIHGIHGRAPAIASGLRIARPDITVWVATGDGDGLSIGGNHMVHAMRRNMDLKILLFNNRIYGLTKGQVSPTSERGKRTVSTPYGSVEAPVQPISVALGSGATFVARALDVHVKHLTGILERAARHKGTAFIEIYQNCNIFNDGAFQYAADKNTRPDTTLELVHGEPMLFGADKQKGIRMSKSFQPEVVTVGENGATLDDILVHDEQASNPGVAFMLSQMLQPDFPEPLGIFRAVEEPVFETSVEEQIESVKAKKKPDLQSILAGPETWEIE